MTSGGSYKKKAKERREQARVDAVLDDQIRAWLADYGHAQERHVGQSTADLDGRNISVATTFETDDDLRVTVTDLLTVNEAKLNHWYTQGDGSRLVLWVHLNSNVRGRRKLKRPHWHYKQPDMSGLPHPGFEDIPEGELLYAIGVFDRDAWTGSPKGLVT